MPDPSLKAALAAYRKGHRMNAYNVNDICSMIRISRTTFYELRKRGKAPRITKINGRSLIFDDDLQSWRESLRQEGERQ